MLFQILGPQLPMGACRVSPEIVAIVPFVGGSDRPGGEVAATVWTDARKQLEGAFRAKRALKTANLRVLRGGWQILVAALAVWAQVKHWKNSGNEGREPKCH